MGWFLAKGRLMGNASCGDLTCCERKLGNKVAVVYPFFALYRRPVLSRLAARIDGGLLLVGDRENRVMPGVPVWDVGDEMSFRSAKTKRLFGGVVYQHDIIGLGFDRSLDTVVYLGNWQYPATWLSAIISRICGKRVLFWTHGWKQPRSGLLGRLIVAFYRIPHALLLYGNAARDIAIRNGFSPDNVHVVFNSLDNQVHKSLRGAITRESVLRIRAAIFKNANLPVVICSSRLTERKRLDFCFRALHRLASQGHFVNMIVIGDGPKRTDLEGLAVQLGIDVHFEGQCFDERRIAELTLASNVTVSPRATGLTAIQSMAFGRAVITSDCMVDHGPEVEAIVPGVTGDFYRDGDVEDLARVVRGYTERELPCVARAYRCHLMVDAYYNPEFQVEAIMRAIRGEDAAVVDLKSLYD